MYHTVLGRGESQEQELIPLKTSGPMAMYSSKDLEAGGPSRGTSLGSEIEAGSSIRLRSTSDESAARGGDSSPDEFIDIHVRGT